MKLNSILATFLLALTTIPAFGMQLVEQQSAPLLYDLMVDSEYSGVLPARTTMRIN